MSDIRDVFHDRLESKFAAFREKHRFVDCRIITPNNTIIECHQLLLAKYSNYFRKYFNNHHSGSPVIDCHVDLDISGKFSFVIDFIYDHTAPINERNVCAILALSRYYEIPTLIRVASDRLRDLTSKNTVLRLCHDCLECNDLNDPIEMAPVISQFYDKYREIDIIRNLSNGGAQAFAAAINNLNPEIFSMSDDEKLAAIDHFYAVAQNTKKLTDDDREALARVINWEQENAFHFLIVHRCAWLPSSISRPLYRQVLAARRRNLRFYRDSAASVQANNKESSRWYSAAWLQAIFEGYVVEKDSFPEVPAVKFTKSLGGLLNTAKLMQAGEGCDFGTLQIGIAGIPASLTPSTKKLAPSETENWPVSNMTLYGPRKAFDGLDSTYFFAHHPCGITVDFGKGGKLSCRKIVIDPHPKELKKRLIAHTDKYGLSFPSTKVPIPRILTFKDTTSSQRKNPRELTLNLEDYGPNSEYFELSLEEKPLDDTEGLEITMKGTNLAQGTTFRLQSVEIYGIFKP